ncbi:hypothetical protein HK44_020815 [Pseudomonas fluorescens HK44]|uniref:Uncharacterized protein n=1 Tax=Pseudomonas fluorescens HK44 TaxID=1042209 RepID=A0A010TGV4_PSEFL|nr:hypothetical protein [Pseudomonas fluorescens]EXF96297.1 hypothetical protein HK44_020815 [Pseudomonas fluorescens HK44]
MDYFQSLLTTIVSIDFSPLKSLVDLNDLRNLAAILGVAIGLTTASKKWGNKAVYFATIGASSNSPLSITSLSIANLKDKPLIIYEINVIFKKTNRYFRLQKFDPPLVIKGLEATTFVPEKYSELEIKPNPFLEFNSKIDLILITESSAIKCKPAESPESIVYRHMKRHRPITVSRRIFNKKIYSKETALALVYMYEGTQRTSFLLNNGLFCDEWPFHTNMLSKTLMQNRESIIAGIDEIAEQNKVQINIIELP